LGLAVAVPLTGTPGGRRSRLAADPRGPGRPKPSQPANQCRRRVTQV